MGKRLHRQRERPESIRKWQLFSCASGAWATSWSCCQGDSKLSQLVGRLAVGFDGGGGGAEDVSLALARRWHAVDCLVLFMVCHPKHISNIGTIYINQHDMGKKIFSIYNPLPNNYLIPPASPNTWWYLSTYESWLRIVCYFVVVSLVLPQCVSVSNNSFTCGNINSKHWDACVHIYVLICLCVGAGWGETMVQLCPSRSPLPGDGTGHGWGEGGESGWLRIGGPGWGNWANTAGAAALLGPPLNGPFTHLSVCLLRGWVLIPTHWSVCRLRHTLSSSRSVSLLWVRAFLSSHQAGRFRWKWQCPQSLPC